MEFDDFAACVEETVSKPECRVLSEASELLRVSDSIVKNEVEDEEAPRTLARMKELAKVAEKTEYAGLPLLHWGSDLRIFRTCSQTKRRDCTYVQPPGSLRTGFRDEFGTNHTSQ